MLKNILLVSALFAAAYCSSELAIVNTPSSLSFTKNDPIPANDVGKLITASLGYPIIDPSQWSDFTILDPFNTPIGAVAININGVEKLNFDSLKSKTYPIDGTEIHDSLSEAEERVAHSQGQSVTLDFNDGPSIFAPYKYIFGEIKGKPEKISTSLKRENPDEKQFLDQLSLLSEFTKVLETTDKHLPNFINIHLTTVNGNAASQTEALKLLTAAVELLVQATQKAYGQDKVLILCTSSKDAVVKRTRRATDVKNKGDPIPKDLNLAKTYSQDYPVIFNIILWFGVVIAFSLLAISYAIASMDPGRDSIIYRMTSNRIKKDN